MKRAWRLILSAALLVLCAALGLAHRGGIGVSDASGPVRTADPRLLELRLADIGVADWIVATVAPQGQEPLVLVLANGLANATVWLPAIMLLASFLWCRSSRRLACYLLVTALSAEAAAFAAKVLFHPAFPSILLVDEVLPEDWPDPLRTVGRLVWLATTVADYPSGHVVRVAAAVVFLLSTGGHWPARLRWLLLGVCGAFVALVGIGRLTGGYHLPSAVVGGTLLGSSLALVWVHAFRLGSRTDKQC